ncbi:MAG TPA: T9SS type A sorting domain-containing protein [Ignavibacteria bacterium]|nr:T9SS type A sorting domain-containing protein [Ignavibacteria bacterium]
MKKLKITFFTISIFILFFSISVILQASIDGRTGRTKKTSTSGCGGCHGSSATLDVSVLIAGPDTVTAGQTKQFSLTISKPSKTGAGLDIATRKGVLAPVSTNIHLASGELTQNDNIPMSGGTVTVLFNYTAPAIPAEDTLWATGLATNSDGGTSGDDWNWAVSKKIIVKLATEISPLSSEATDYNLSQNYPNPFNPVTELKFGISKPGFVSLKIYDILGNEVTTVVNSALLPGTYSYKYDASALSSGVYYYSIISGDFKETKRMLLVK